MMGLSSLKRLFCVSAVLAGSVLMLASCERPFVEPRRPVIEVVSPDLSIVQTGDEIEVVIRAETFRPVETVVIDGAALARDTTEAVWRGRVPIKGGLNRMIVRAVDSGGIEGVDTLYVLSLRSSMTPAPGLSRGRGGHAAALLEDGRVLVTGGAPAANAQAVASGFTFDPSSDTYSNVAQSLYFPRIGHSANRLRDGRVLIAGGAFRADITHITDLADDAEVFEPATGRFRRVTVAGRPIRRAYHAAAMLELVRNGVNETYLLIHGGRGDIRAGTDTPTLGIRRDMAVYEFRNDSLIYTGLAGSGQLPGIFGHSMTPVAPFDQRASAHFLLAGTFFLEDDTPDDVVYKTFYRPDTGIGFQEAAPFIVPRFHHAAAPAGGFAVYFGGRASRAGNLTTRVELYSGEAGRFFIFPGHMAPLEGRWGHTATKLDDGRILLLGGFDTNGVARETARWFDPGVD